MHVRKFDRKLDYPMVADWWYGNPPWKPVPMEILPEIGLVVGNKNRELCAGWMYKTNSQLAYMEWIIGNPKADKKERSNALDILIEALYEEAKKLDAIVIFTNIDSKHVSMIERYQDHGFVISDKSMTHFVRGIN